MQAKCHLEESGVRLGILHMGIGHKANQADIEKRERHVVKY